MSTKIYIFFLSFFWMCSNIKAQSAQYFTGLSSTIGGTNFSYHSPFSFSDECLLVRANKEFDPIVWETEAVPNNFVGKEAYFIWLYGIDAQQARNEFNLFLNDNKVLTFTNALEDLVKTTYVGQDGIELVLNRTMVDSNTDEMGFAVLKVPSKFINKGKPIKLTVDAVDNQSSCWYMTFKRPLKEGFSAYQLKNIAKNEGALFNVIRFDIIHPKEAAKGSISMGEQTKKFNINTGFNEIDFMIPLVDTSTEMSAVLKIGKKSEKVNFTVNPVKEWTIHLVQHSHTDIGYTRSQTEILSEHLRFIDYALDYCDQTDNYPKEAQFRWTCEAAWVVREYLKSRPKSQIDRLMQRIKEGRIEVTGMFFNFSEIVDETALAIQTQTLKYFKDQGIDVTTAMQNDVNGIGWCMIDLYKGTGVKYLTMGQHGHRAHVPFDKPTSFWWESQSGNRLLAYRSEHYMHGNILSLTSGSIDVFRANLTSYLNKLEAKGYPYNKTAFQFSGYITDNSPPSIKACEIVKEWNEKYEWPKLKLSLASEFMIYLEENESGDLPVKKKAWPDWWTDGFGSAFNATKASRITHSNMIANMGILSMAKLMGATLPQGTNEAIISAFDELLFYDEHTFGAAESIRDPLSENSVLQWGQKSAYAWTAFKESSLIQEKAMGFIQQFIEKSDLPTIAVFNTLNWKRSGLVDVYIDHEILPLGKKFEIRDQNGNSIKAQRTSQRADGSHWLLWVPDIPPMGYALFTIKVDNEANKSLQNVPLTRESILENEYYAITMDIDRGVITSIVDKELNKELVDLDSKMKLGEFILEELDNRASLERLTNQNRDTVYVPVKKTVTSLSDIQHLASQETPLWKSVTFNGKISGVDERGVNMEIRLYKTTKKIELAYDMVKLPVTDPEGIYVAFPFKLSEEDELAFEVQGGTVVAGVNQIEGTASDWNTIQNFVAVKNPDMQVIFSSEEVPLVQFGDLNIGHFYYKRKPKQAHIYSWVLNNYWTTNFRASQEGEMKWRYSFTSSANNSNIEATRFGWGNRIPMLARVIPTGEQKARVMNRSLFDPDVVNLLLVNARPAPSHDGVILHLRETAGDHAILDISRLLEQSSAREAIEVNILGEEIQKLTRPLLIEHFETKFILLKK